MNQYQKQKSREIRDIMRTDKWGQMTYKDAARKWRKGIRAFKIGEMHAWKTLDCSKLGFSREQLKEAGQEYYRLLRYCAERNLTLDCRYDSFVDHYELRFTGRSADGKRYGIQHSVTGILLQQYVGPLSNITDRVLEQINTELQEFHFPSPMTTGARIESLYPRMMIHPWEPRDVEDAIGGLIRSEQRRVQ